MDTTKCSRCREQDRNQPDNYCRACRSELNRIWRERNPERKRELNARHNPRRVYVRKGRTRGFLAGLAPVLNLKTKGM